MREVLFTGYQKRGGQENNDNRVQIAEVSNRKGRRVQIGRVGRGGIGKEGRSYSQSYHHMMSLQCLYVLRDSGD
jgi:hypothetical protein